jgi:spore photoproduct lyase
MRRRNVAISRGGPWLPFEERAAGYVPRPVDYFRPSRIVLSRGSLNAKTAGRTEAICRAYPDAEVVDQSDRSHAQIELDALDPLARHEAGKSTLVIGEHKSAVRFSQEQRNCCPNYWHFSPYGFCPYGCTYCYLAGTRGIWFSPTVKVFLNLDEMLGRIDDIARQAGLPVGFYLGKLQDGLALDPLTGYSRRLVPFFAQHRWARLIVLTKSADVENLMGLEPRDNVVLSWSLTSKEAWRRFEPGTPSPAQRLAAIRRCAAAGYRIRVVLMPILPIPDWLDGYATLLDDLLESVPVERITLGSLCSFPNALRLTNAKLGSGNLIQELLKAGGRCPDGRYRFGPQLRTQCYRLLAGRIHSRRPDLPVGLCLEERAVFASSGLSDNVGICNCVL